MSDADQVVLSFPRKSQYYSVARLVVGGLAAPLQMSYDALDDLQLAISSLLDNEDLPGGEELELRLQVGGDRMDATLGSFPASSVEGAFDRTTAGDGGLGLRKLLDTIVDEVEVTPDSNGQEWVRLTKRVGAPV
jgi:hypothetical protein